MTRRGGEGWNRSYRRSANRWWLTFLGSVFVLTCLAVAITPDPSSGLPDDQTIDLPARVVFGLAGTVLTVMLIRWIRSGIFTSRTGVTFRNVLSTRTLRWGDVVRFERPAPYGTWRKAGLRAITHDGGVVASSTYQAGPFNQHGFADTIVAELEELRGRASEVGAEGLEPPTSAL